MLQLVLPHRDVGGTAGQGRPGQTLVAGNEGHFTVQAKHTAIACVMNEVTRDLGCFMEFKYGFTITVTQHRAMCWVEEAGCLSVTWPYAALMGTHGGI